MNSTLPTPPTDLSRLLAEVERLDKEASKGPWNNEGHTWIYAMVPNGRPNGEGIATFRGETHHGMTREQDTKNAEFTAFARTALPQLAAIVAQLETHYLKSIKLITDEGNARLSQLQRGRDEVEEKLRTQEEGFLTVDGDWSPDNGMMPWVTELTTLRAQLAAAQQRVEELEGKRPLCVCGNAMTPELPDKWICWNCDADAGEQLAQARAELEGVKGLLKEVHVACNSHEGAFGLPRGAMLGEVEDRIAAMQEEKCPICKGIPERPEIEGCAGCLECDFTGTKEAYEATQKFNHEAYEAARSAEGARG